MHENSNKQHELESYECRYMSYICVIYMTHMTHKIYTETPIHTVSQNIDGKKRRSKEEGRGV